MKKTILICLLLFVVACQPKLDIAPDAGSAPEVPESPHPSEVEQPEVKHEHSDEERKEEIKKQEYAEKVSGSTLFAVGDGKRSSTSPQVGYIYTCETSFNGAAAHAIGKWVDEEAGVWDPSQKAVVDGDVSWNSEVSFELKNEKRLIISNGLPSHTTGNFPIAASDDAYDYDRNPNSISEQEVMYELPANPGLADKPSCVSLGAVAYANTGVAIYNGLDGLGRDAAVHEIQDKCDGHPEQSEEYHYHGWSDCILDDSEEDEHSDIIGYALDGFGLYGLYGEGGVELSSEHLDECHGHVHTIDWDGTEKEMYHYHMTRDYPYSLGCYKGIPVVKTIDG